MTKKEIAITEVTKLREQAETTRLRCVAGSDVRIKQEGIVEALDYALEILAGADA